MRIDGVGRLALGFVGLVAGCATVPKARTQPEVPVLSPTRDEVLAKIERDIAAEVKAKRWPSLAIGIVYDGKLSWWRGFGEIDSASHAPVTDQTYFRYGSITKTFTGLALLQLRDAGKLSLDDPLEKFIPEVKEVVYPTAERPPIRLRHLVTHTSAFPRAPSGLDYGDPAHVLTEADLIAALDGMTLDGTPGAFDGYSNYANCLSGIVIHRASGVPYEDWILNRIAAPLGLGIRWRQEDIPPGRLATGHSLGPKLKQDTVEVPRSWVMGACNSCGGMFGSLSDLAGYAAFELSPWPPRDAPESPVASRATLRESQMPRGKSYGVNWGFDQDATLGYLVGHSGEVAGYSAVLLMSPERGIAVVALLGFDDGVGDLQRLVKSSLTKLAPVFPRSPLPLAGSLRARIDQLIGLLEPNAGPVPEDFFTKEFVRFVLDKKETVEGHFSMLRQRGGRCRVSTLRESTANMAKLRLDCARGAIEASVWLSTRSPHSIAGFGYDFPP